MIVLSEPFFSFSGSSAESCGDWHLSSEPPAAQAFKSTGGWEWELTMQSTFPEVEINTDVNGLPPWVFVNQFTGAGVSLLRTGKLLKRQAIV